MSALHEESRMPHHSLAERAGARIRMAGPTPGGWRIVSLRDSQEQSERWRDETRAAGEPAASDRDRREWLRGIGDGQQVKLGPSISKLGDRRYKRPLCANGCESRTKVR